MIRRRARAADPTRQVWPPDALALFAEYRDMRQVHAPPECNTGDACWVRDGPPAISGNHGGNHHCLGCQGKPRPPLVVARQQRLAKC